MRAWSYLKNSRHIELLWIEEKEPKRVIRVKD